jgi:hypothetical protein
MDSVQNLGARVVQEYYLVCGEISHTSQSESLKVVHVFGSSHAERIYNDLLAMILQWTTSDSRVTSVSRIPGYGLGEWISIRLPTLWEYFFFHHRIETGSGAHPTPVHWALENFSGLKLSDHERNHLHLSSTVYFYVSACGAKSQASEITSSVSFPQTEGLLDMKQGQQR